MDKPLKRREQFHGKFNALPSSLQSRFRVLRTGVREALNPKQLVHLGVASTAVFSIGFYEAILMSKGRPDYWFCMRYGSANILPSIIWGTKDARLVARAMGHDPEKLLRNISGETTKGAHRLLRIQTAFALRSVIAGFVGIGQILAFASSGIEAAAEYKRSVMVGREPFLKGVKERVIRFSGTSSDVTLHSLSRFGSHILPIYEDASLVQPVMEKITKGGVIPSYWCVPNKKYGDAHSWEGFQFNRDWLLTGVDGQKILVLEADSSMSEQALALSGQSANDLTLQEASMGFRAIVDIAERDHAFREGDQLARVMLMDTMAKFTSGGGATYTLRQRAEEQNEVDIIIDTRVPLNQAIVKWAREKENEKGLTKAVVVFDTDNQLYFESLTKMLKGVGYQVIDRSQVKNLKENEQALWLVYQATTAETVNQVYSLATSKLVDPEMICALVDNPQGIEQLRMAESKAGVRMDFICSAHIYDSIFSNVRMWLRDGYSCAKVQTFLDQTWNKEY
mmetsp:Transcript_31099/g.41131  ORF Transcript_31099/g.41131 Transcript_31099/m.41131 type:complete len:508 (-) Transcript_31099:220-1743(-)|eukprot:CAMPEP_0117752888 /NCGR_PEP_ID=MMETSP0947-20121206/11893_1 /TAXON_ID=44440 /ORGANISM="Chattonella subsalsa, Strain CCMP2191" /LENGTH=507 /DNA_ID=CAMNT_0005571655 /DNA_START=120 /DNA_END=1643 /DNA_ORIENTATION=-